MMKGTLALFCNFLLVIGVHARVGEQRIRPHRKLQTAADGGIPNQYIVQFRPDLQDVEAKVDSMVENHQSEDGGPTISQVYTTVFPGFVVSNCTQDELSHILDDDDVIVVSQDEYASNGYVQHSPENWGLDRIDQEDLPMDDQFVYHASGNGVTVYVLDNGILSSHQEFNDDSGSRVTCGFNGYEGIEDCQSGSDHGTHVAGIIGGATFGVAKKVNLISIKVLPSSGVSPWSIVIGGIDFVAAQKRRHPHRPAVMNLSLWGGFYRPVNNAVEAAVDAGVIVVTIAGNHNGDTCDRSPGSSRDAITVAATSTNDYRSYFSGYGDCVDIFAPGQHIMSAIATDGDNGSTRIQGTSMAAPHVAGAAALYLEQFPHATPREVWKAIRDSSSKDNVRDPKGSPNLLLYTAALTNEASDVGTIRGFTLVNSRSEEDIGSIEDGAIFNVKGLRNRLTVRAETEGAIGSTVFDLNDEQGYQTEDVSPFMLGGNLNQDTYHVSDLRVPGAYTIAATPFSHPSGRGISGETAAVTFSLVDFCIEKLVLVDVRLGTDIVELSDGAVVELDKPLTRRLTIRAEACGEPGSVIFIFNDEQGHVCENSPPFLLGGDYNGSYRAFPELVAPGSYRVEAIPFASADGEGVAGQSVVVQFELR